MKECNNLGFAELKGGSYSGVPKFIVETLSPSPPEETDQRKKRYMNKQG